MLKELEIKDLIELEKDARFPLSNIKNPVLRKSIFQDDELIGMLVVNLTTETSIVLKNSVSKLKRARAIIEIFKFLERELVLLGFHENHVFIKEDKRYSNLLKKHFNFEEVIGEPLVKRKV